MPLPSVKGKVTFTFNSVSDKKRHPVLNSSGCRQHWRMVYFLSADICLPISSGRSEGVTLNAESSVERLSAAAP